VLQPKITWDTCITPPNDYATGTSLFGFVTSFDTFLSDGLSHAQCTGMMTLLTSTPTSFDISEVDVVIELVTSSFNCSAVVWR
jgi:hypothetical protein